ncbi:hypothetical protein [Jatrophihabitans sp.]|uniref:hypothetical protein n=1 Tax=Jatrophihabitans sp. TaxID=1932789 RepID=UPI0030C6B0B9|nr:hypothetical protein [Jatrophihabitans sp.]
MNLFHKAAHRAAGKGAGEDLGHADYDAQADLALPTGTDPENADDGFVPFAGMLTPEHDEPAYDVSRDTAT